MSRNDHAGRTITLGYLNFFDLHPAGLIALAGDAGFVSAGIRITGRRPGDPYHEIVGNGAVVDEIARLARETGVSISNISSYHLYPDIDLETLEPVFETMQRLGVGTLIVACYDRETSRFCDFLTEAAALASSYGVRFAFEFVPFSEAPNVASARRILDHVPSPNLGLLLDPLHLARSGGSPDDLRDLDRDRIFMLQLCDATARRPQGMDLREEARKARLFPGEGELPLAAFLDAVPSDTEIEIEAPHQAYADLAPVEQARLMRVATAAYLAGLRAGGSGQP